MVFGNLLNPPHLKRFLLALLAGSAAIVIYLTAEHFQVIPGTAALDEEAPEPPALGELSVLVIPEPGDCPDNRSSFLALEAIRQLVRIPELEVIAPRSALVPGRSDHETGPELPVIETAWQLHITCSARGVGRPAYSASLLADTANASRWETARHYPEDQLQEFIREITQGLSDEFEIGSSSFETRSVMPSAYLDFLHARWLLHSDMSRASEAEALLDGVLDSEPGWAAALATRAYSRLLQQGTDPISAGEQLQAAKTDLDEALQQNPGESDAHLYRSIIAHRFQWDWSAAYEAAVSALENAPGDAGVLAAASTAAFTLGRFEEGAQWLHKAIPLDPLVLSHRLKYGLMLEFSGQPRAAIEAYRELKILDPYYPGVHAYLGRSLIVGDRIKLALPHMEIERNAFWRKYGTILALYAMERPEEAGPKFEQFIQQHEHEAAVQIAEIMAYSGQVEEAFGWLDKAVDQRDPGVSELVGNPLLGNLFDDPRWERLVDELGLTKDPASQ